MPYLLPITFEAQSSLERLVFANRGRHQSGNLMAHDFAVRRHPPSGFVSIPVVQIILNHFTRNLLIKMASAEFFRVLLLYDYKSNKESPKPFAQKPLPIRIGLTIVKDIFNHV